MSDELADLLKQVAPLLPDATPEEAAQLQRIIRAAASNKTEKQREIESDPNIWRQAVLRKYFSKPDGWFHKEFWAKMWALERDIAPPPLILPWARDLGKSMSIRAGGLSAAARGLRRYILYFSLTQDQSDKHVLNMSRMLKYSTLAAEYPDMATALLSDVHGGNVSWNRKRIVTASGLVIDSLGLDSASRGINYEELRPDMIFADDIDKLGDSDLEVRKKIELLSGSIFPTGQDNTWIIFAQNVIHDNSVMARTIDDRAEILLDADIIGPVPALKSYSYDRSIGRGGRQRFKITSGTPSWPEGFSLIRAEKELNASGYEGFEREYQHNTKLTVSGALYPGWSPLHHIVTWEELARGFAEAGMSIVDKLGEPYIPYHWYKGLGLDYGTSLEHPSVLRWVTVSGEFEPYNDIWIFYRERCLPKYPHQKGEAVEAVSPIVLSKVIREEEFAWREGDNMITRVMSHEQSAAMLTFNEDEKLFADKAYDFGEATVDFAVFEGLDFKKRKGDARSGIAQMQNRLTIDQRRPHPFRRYPEGHTQIDKNGEVIDLSGQPIMGRPFVIFVVDNDQGGLYLNTEDALNVQNAIDDAGMVRMRAERVKYKNAVSQDGREMNKPVAIFDDSMSAERYIAEEFAVTCAPGSLNERLENAVKERAPHLGYDAIMRNEVTLARQMQFTVRQNLIDDIEDKMDDADNPRYGNALVDREEKLRRAR